MKKDVLAVKEYELKVTIGNLAAKVLANLEYSKKTSASTSRMEYSKRDELKKELLIEAVRAAKNKAQYMLVAIGQKVGKPLIIDEQAGNNYAAYFARNLYANTISTRAVGDADETDMKFKKLNYQFSVNATFETN